VLALHTSDWHLGRTVLGHSRSEDFDAVLAEIVELAADVRPDIIIHSGDLFDTVRPPTAELQRGMRALHELSRIAPTVVVAGNHDSPALLRVLDFIANQFGEQPEGGPRRLTFVDRPRRPEDGGILHFPAADGAERIRLAALPFVHHNRFVDDFHSPETATRDYAEHLRRIQAEYAAALAEGHNADTDVNLFAAHLYVEGATPSYSERPIDISEDYALAADSLPSVAYGALGHIHKPQAVPRTPFAARYAGSPLQMDFGEAGEDKTVVVVEASPGRAVEVETVPLRAGRRLMQVEGDLEHLATVADRVGDSFVKAVVDTEKPTLHLAEAVMEALPKATVVRVEERCAANRAEPAAGETAAHEEPDLPELFDAYLGEIDVPGSAALLRETFSELLAAETRERPETWPEEEQLRSAIEAANAGRAIEAANAGRAIEAENTGGAPGSGRAEGEGAA
jgi:DNA repair protein SbcD/Mre11